MRITEYRARINKDNLNELVKEKAINYQIDSKQLNSPESITDMMKSVFYIDERAEEYVYMLALDTKCKPIGIFEISHGTVNMSMINPREVFIRALLVGAVSIALIHNHPSGDATPSREDISATKRLAECGKLLGVVLLDHIVIGHDYTSLKADGYL